MPIIAAESGDSGRTRTRSEPKAGRQRRAKTVDTASVDSGSSDSSLDSSSLSSFRSGFLSSWGRQSRSRAASADGASYESTQRRHGGGDATARPQEAVFLEGPFKAEILEDEDAHTGPSSGSRSTRYAIKVVGADGEHVVRRRYTRFAELSLALDPQSRWLPKMPPKSFFRRRLSAGFREERVLALVKLLDAILYFDPFATGKALRAFLGLREAKLSKHESLGGSPSSFQQIVGGELSYISEGMNEDGQSFLTARDRQSYGSSFPSVSPGSFPSGSPGSFFAVPTRNLSGKFTPGSFPAAASPRTVAENDLFSSGGEPESPAFVVGLQDVPVGRPSRQKRPSSAGGAYEIVHDV